MPKVLHCTHSAPKPKFGLPLIGPPPIWQEALLRQTLITPRHHAVGLDYVSVHAWWADCRLYDLMLPTGREWSNVILIIPPRIVRQSWTFLCKIGTVRYEIITTEKKKQLENIQADRQTVTPGGQLKYGDHTRKLQLQTDYSPKPPTSSD